MRDLAELVAARERVLSEFLAQLKDRLALASHAMARAFSRGGTLLAYGTGAAATDAAHVAVEFMHPVIVGKRALPALAPPADVLGIMRAGDIAVGIAHGDDPKVASFLEHARTLGALTLSFGTAPADFVFAVPDDDPHVVQEVQETTYHVLWELVQVFFEHPGLLADTCITCGDVAVEARVVAVENGSAWIEKDGLREQVAVDLVEGVGVGDVLLCHAGVALEKLA
jgi:D-sedoheptulose 7-phosphate isomerase